MRKRLTAALLCLCLLFTLLPATAFAEGEPDSGPPLAQSALCEHHPQHDESCGYTEGTEGSPCTHEHDEDCYTLVTECAHEHTAECYPAESVSENTATPSEPEEAEPTACTHVCSEESGCITKTLDCKHEHDEACGYVPATAGTPCTFVCEICNAQDSGNPANPSDAQPEECTCEALCTEDNTNGDCPVCGAEGADLSECEGLEAQPATLSNALPATALAAENAPTTLYVGNYQITNGNATTYLKAGSTQGSLVEGSENDWTVKYDPSTATMTLNVATITGNDNISSVPYGAGIYAQCNSGQPVTLTIELIGENIITGNYGIYVNAEMSANSYGTDASLNITGNGSLIVTGTNSHGLFVKSGTGNASLTINDASVVANTTHTYSGSAGICVQSSVSATSSPNLSLAVDGGSLTASGTGNSDGILLYVGSSQATGATTSLTVTDNAIVDARNGGISASKISETLPTPTPTGDNSSGIVFDGSTGTVYGEVTLQGELTINNGETLQIPDGASLNGNGKLTNDGTIIVENGGTLTGENIPTEGVVYKVAEVTLSPSTLNLDVGESSTLTATITPDNATNKNVTWSSDNQNVATVENGKVTAVGAGSTTITVTTEDGGKTATCSVTVNAPATTITTQPSNVTVTEGETATFSVAATGGGTLTYQWQQSTDNGSTWTDISGATSSSYTTQAATMDMDSYQYRCVVTGAGGEATSNAATLTVNPKQYTVTVQTDGSGTASASTTAAAAGTEITLTATPDSGYHFERWEVVSGTITIQNDKFIMPAENVTVKAVFDRNSSGGGTSYDYYTITATAGEGGSISPSGNISVREGRDKTFTITPADGYVISDVRVDGVSVGAVSSYTFEDVQKKHTIEAVFAKDNPDTGVDNPFTDVHPDDWFYDHVMFVYQNGLMAGTSDTTFSPNAPITRAQVAVIFYRMAGSPAVTGDSPFTDVKNGPGTAWYYNAVLWAQQNGIVSGYGDGTFRPGTDITREQLAVIFYNYAKHKGYDVSAVNDLSGFTDAGDVSDWALPAMRWAVGSGIMGGYGDGILGPQGTATRAQVAAMLRRFIENNKLVPPAVVPGGDSGTTGTGGTGSGGGGWTQQITSPQTGDSSNIGLWFSLMLLSLSGIVVLLVTEKVRRRRMEDEEASHPMIV